MSPAACKKTFLPRSAVFQDMSPSQPSSSDAECPLCCRSVTENKIFFYILENFSLSLCALLSIICPIMLCSKSIALVLLILCLKINNVMKLGEEQNSVCILSPGLMIMKNLIWSISWASPINCQAVVDFISANHPWVFFFSIPQASVQTGHHTMWSHVLPALPWSSFGSSQILSGLPHRAGPEVVAYPGRVLASSCFLILDQ